jgi:hypothetical protein
MYIMRLCHFGELRCAAVGNARQAIALMASASVNIDTSPRRRSAGQPRLRLDADELKA